MSEERECQRTLASELSAGYKEVDACEKEITTSCGAAVIMSIQQ
jgi:hypothetical protein